MSATFKKLIGKRIRDARKQKEWRLEDLSEATGHRLSVSRIGNYESGARTVPPWEAKTLGDALGVSAAYLMCLEEDDIMKMTNPEEEKLLRNFRALPENERFDVARSIEIQAVQYKRAKPDSELEHLSARPKSERSRRPKVKGAP